MSKLTLKEIKKIYSNPDKVEKGFIIEFNDGKKIYLTKRRTIIALLVLIHKGVGSEADLANRTTIIPLIKRLLNGKIPDNFIQDSYGDANKPFSELWNEEGFTWIDNLKSGKVGKSQSYILKDEDHNKFFGEVRKIKKANRKAPSYSDQQKLKDSRNGRCNICGTIIVPKKDLEVNSFSRDRRREVCEHRVPVEKGGHSTNLTNYQMLCFYCNKSKWQICNICTEDNCDNCALAFPEEHTTIAPTKEDISDRMANREVFNID